MTRSKFTSEKVSHYPFGLTHKGYNADHKIIIFTPETHIIQLVPVTPDLTDTYKYKFGGKEWQDELDLNYYDFGARNYDAALVRTLTPDPMAEVYYELSPYSFLNNNPISNIDPTGAVTLTGQAAKDWFQNLKDEIASKPRKRKEEKEEEEFEDNIRKPSSINEGCPDGDCDDEKMLSIISHSEHKVVGGHVFSSLEILLEETTEYIIGGVFDIFGFNKDYQDGTVLAASLFFSRRGSSKVAAKTVGKFKFPGNNPAKAPKGFEWKGQPGSTPGSKNGNWFNPKTGESLRPDLNHPNPIGPHWDYKDSSGKWWRIFPDGNNVPK